MAPRLKTLEGVEDAMRKRLAMRVWRTEMARRRRQLGRLVEWGGY